MSLINFELIEPSQINPYNTGLVWFYLSDSRYWIELPNVTLYEISPEYSNLNVEPDDNLKTANYVNYELAMLIEDFQSLFEAIAEEIPDDIYELTQNADNFFALYSANNSKLESLFDDLSADEYYDLDERANKWISERTLVATHLYGNPSISFFRSKNGKLTIIWDFDRAVEIEGKRIPIWTAEKGTVEIEYQSFVEEINDFKKRAFGAMEIQVAKANKLNWRNCPADNKNRIEEHRMREKEFEHHLSFLQEKPSKVEKTSWAAVRQALNKLKV